MNISEILNSINPGEIVLIEHTSLSPYPIVFSEVLKNSKNTLIIDFLDSSLYVIRWLKFAGYEIPEKLKRIKIGGTSKWGNVIAEIDPYKDPLVLVTKFITEIMKVYKENPNTTTIVLNHEKLLGLYNYDQYLVLEVLSIPTSLIGNPLRRAFVFMNYELTEPKYLALFEEVATRVIRIGNKGEVKIIKSIRPEEEDIVFKLQLL
ncbi:DUF257 family protein [Pyrococcus sp. ST04]|uniref:DUF257 family protein n=1 Tax=Pyrococcus sp. ST04 TaxID=1183377 RepID=UPI0002605E73|nr:DUF257 family protein [Pyrococcus sp. ST04]AFK23188.1 hypothetical protein Py04_1618 [Pyrococcus sp. ST04]